MSPQAEQSKPGDVPPAELNPLQNPLLAQNMGRWAHVYFNTAPDKREEAVQELVRQLEQEKQQQEAGKHPVGNDAIASLPVSERQETPESSRTEPAAGSLVCPECGRVNPLTQRYCGTCGLSLISNGHATEAGDYDQHGHEGEPHGREVYAAHDQYSYRGEESEEHHQAESDPYDDSHDVRDNGYNTRLNSNELSLFQTIQDRDYYAPQEDDDEIFSTPSSGSPRIWIGLVLLLILGGLGYLAWRNGMLRSSQDSPLAPPPEATAKETSSPAPSSNPAPAAEPAKSEAQPAAASHEDQPPAAAAPKTAPETTAKAEPRPRAQRHSKHAPSRPTEAMAGAGAQDLATAQAYLNGKNGQRNSSEAAKWLWKAVGNHNPEASFLLSELYLRGDGVSKNCDQARVLLDSAVLKGVKGAGQRLRHLSAFGCQ